mgnify:FL=1
MTTFEVWRGCLSSVREFGKPILDRSCKAPVLSRLSRIVLPSQVCWVIASLFLLTPNPRVP